MLEEYLSKSRSDALNEFLETLAVTNRTPEYYVNWNKVTTKTETYEIELNTLNYLIGKKDIYSLSKDLFLKQPNLLKTIPLLIGCRDIQLDILIVKEEDISFSHLPFDHIDTSRIDEYMEFAVQSGLLNFLSNHANRSLVDYVYGVEVGLDSNGRKNRSGKSMETILETHIKALSKELDLKYSSQVSAANILEIWGVHVPVDKSERRFDGAVFDPHKKRLYVIETNYYGGGGSKLKAVCGEFTTLNKLIETSEDDVTFVWVTDGMGWKTTKIPLSEAFEQIPNIFNIQMLENDYLKNLIEMA